VPTAFVFINTVPASMQDVLNKVKAIEGVEEAAMLYGVFDIAVKVTTDTMEQLKQIVSSKIRMLPNVLTTNTLLVVRQE
jgi:DNA-binding Lrp family transcriptional regulator